MRKLSVFRTQAEIHHFCIYCVGCVCRGMGWGQGTLFVFHLEGERGMQDSLDRHTGEIQVLKVRHRLRLRTGKPLCNLSASCHHQPRQLGRGRRKALCGTGRHGLPKVKRSDRGNEKSLPRPHCATVQPVAGLVHICGVLMVI